MWSSLPLKLEKKYHFVFVVKVGASKIERKNTYLVICTRPYYSAVESSTTTTGFNTVHHFTYGPVNRE